MGKGSIVLCADSFFISNEALRSERHPQLLIWLLGGRSNIIFDESHFGIYQQPGVAGLLRKYRFHWFLGALTVVALLLVWRNAVYFVPPGGQTLTSVAEIVSAQDSTQGLVALLRRNLSGRNILQACWLEWQQTFNNDQRLSSDVCQRMKSILQKESQSSKMKPDPVAGYRQISNMINQQGFYSGSNKTS
jgi:hypothetical protein